MSLKEAVEFVKPATEGLTDVTAFMRFSGGYLTAFDGAGLWVGHPVEEDFAICPHGNKLSTALKKVGDKFSVTELDKGRLSVKGGKLRVVIPCVSSDTIPSGAPDPNIAVLDDELRLAFKRLIPLVKEDGNRLIEYSLLIDAGTMSATNGNVILQYWHGVNLPPKLVVPRKFGLLTSKLDGLCGFGFSERSVTFWYGNGAWIKTQLCTGEWPDVNKILDMPSDAQDLPEDFFEAVKTVSEFSDDGSVRLSPGKLKSAYTDGPTGEGLGGATYDCDGLNTKCTFNAKLLLLLKDVATQMDFDTHTDRAIFFGERIRGQIAKRTH